MKEEHESSYFSIFINEDLKKTYDFTSQIVSGDSLATPVSITIVDSKGADKSASMIASTNVTSPNVSFILQNPVYSDIFEITINVPSSLSLNYTKKIICEVLDSITLNEKLADPSANSYVSLKEANDYIRNVRGHPNKWDTLSIEGRKRVLVQACKDIDKFNFVGKKYYENQSLEFPRDDHDIITGDVSGTPTYNNFKSTDFTSDTYGTYKSNQNYWKYGTIHFTNTASWLGEIRHIASSNIVTDIISVDATFSATPTTNVDFIAFEPLDKKVKNAQCEQALYLIENDGSGTLQNYIDIGARRVQIGDAEVEFGSGSGSAKRSISPKTKILLSQWFQKYKTINRA